MYPRTAPPICSSARRYENVLKLLFFVFFLLQVRIYYIRCVRQQSRDGSHGRATTNPVIATYTTPRRPGIVSTLGSIPIRTALTSFYNNINTIFEIFNKIVEIFNTYISLGLRDFIIISSKTLYIRWHE